MHEALVGLVHAIDKLGYPGIILLMAMESSIIPVPSELVMAPAGYLASKGEMSLWIAILCGTVGSLIGSYANYFVSQYVGRPLILKYGKYVLITPHKFEKVEKFFEKHGEISVFVCRLLPVMRHLISIPAGMSRMNHVRFSTYTVLGAGLWMIVLTYIGYFIGSNEAAIEEYSKQAVLWAIAGSAVLVGGYVLWQRRKANVAEPAA
jgi:membrane protein DedA with SNARE-associated domain